MRESSQPVKSRVLARKVSTGYQELPIGEVGEDTVNKLIVSETHCPN